jgi:antitoxin component YwqK of YwqJK toxin-antitoxin module
MQVQRWKVIDGNKVKIHEDNYKYGKLHGKKCEWNRQGSVVYEYNFRNGRLNGICIEYGSPKRNTDTNKEIITSLPRYESYYINGALICKN